jgi:hypothetical protein
MFNSRMADGIDMGQDVTGKCTFQFWVDRIESFYCKLDECRWNFGDSPGELCFACACQGGNDSQLTSRG